MKGINIKVSVILDDVSRNVLAGGEFSNHFMREFIMDHGSEFGANGFHKDATWNGGFKEYLEILGIKTILGKCSPSTDKRNAGTVCE